MYSFILLTNTKSNAQDEVSCKVCTKKFKKDLVNYDEKLTNSSEEDISIHVTRKSIKVPTYVDDEMHQYPRGNFQMA